MNLDSVNTEIKGIFYIGILLFLLFPDVLMAQRETPEGYKVRISEDFEGDSLNGLYWTKGLWGTNNAHLFPNKNAGGGRNRINDNFAGYVVDSNTVITNGNLELHNVKETIEGIDPALTLEFTNAMINTLGKVKFNGSKNAIRIKMRAKFPVGSDVWPSVWLVAQYDWPPEIDVWEYFGQWFQWGKRDLMKLSWIYGSKFNKEGDISWKYMDFDDKFNIDEFHVYEFEWNDKYMISKIDGTEFSRLTRGGTGDYGVPDNLWPDTNSEYSMIVQNGRMSAVVNQNGLNNSKSNVFVIDYIDVYEKEPIHTKTRDLPEAESNINFVYPNPSYNGLLNINKSYLKGRGTIEIYNLSGQLELIFCMEAISGNTLNLSELDKGIYFIRLNSKQNSITQKFLMN